MERTLAERVCRVLEGLALLEWSPKNEPFIDVVYRFCHIVHGRCPHPDWMAEFLRTEQVVEEVMQSPAWKHAQAKFQEELESKMLDEGCPNHDKES
jgi:hypothetical protein